MTTDQKQLDVFVQRMMEEEKRSLVATKDIIEIINGVHHLSPSSAARMLSVIAAFYLTKCSKDEAKDDVFADLFIRDARVAMARIRGNEEKAEAEREALIKTIASVEPSLKSLSDDIDSGKLKVNFSG